MGATPSGAYTSFTPMCYKCSTPSGLDTDEGHIHDLIEKPRSFKAD